MRRAAVGVGTTLGAFARGNATTALKLRLHSDMTKNHMFAMLVALPLIGAGGCEPYFEPSEQDRARADRDRSEEDRAREQARAQAEEEGYGPLDQRFRGEIASKRVELGNDVGANEPDVESPGLTALQRVRAAEEGELEESGYELDSPPDP